MAVRRLCFYIRNILHELPSAFKINWSSASGYSKEVSNIVKSPIQKTLFLCKKKIRKAALVLQKKRGLPYQLNYLLRAPEKKKSPPSDAELYFCLICLKMNSLKLHRMQWMQTSSAYEVRWNSCRVRAEFVLIPIMKKAIRNFIRTLYYIMWWFFSFIITFHFLATFLGMPLREYKSSFAKNGHFSKYENIR